jgi:uncharacterized protein (TIGR03382 family)
LSGARIVAVALALLGSSSALATITAKRVVFERIDFSSGQFPFNTVPASVFVALAPPPGAPTLLQLPNVFHLSSTGTFVEGSGSMDIGFTNPNPVDPLARNSYFVRIDTQPLTHLLMAPGNPLAGIAPRLTFRYAAVFAVGGNGHPAHPARIFYPFIGRNNALGSWVQVRAFALVRQIGPDRRFVSSTTFFPTRFFAFPNQPVGALIDGRNLPPTPANGFIIVSGQLDFQIWQTRSLGRALAPVNREQQGIIVVDAGPDQDAGTDGGTEADGGADGGTDGGMETNECTGEPSSEPPDPLLATFDAPCENAEGLGLQGGPPEIPDDVAQMAQELANEVAASVPPLPTEPSSALQPNKGPPGEPIVLSNVYVGTGTSKPEIRFGEILATQVEVLDALTVWVVPPPPDGRVKLNEPIDVTITSTFASAAAGQPEGIERSALTESVTVILPGAWTYTGTSASRTSSESHGCASATGSSGLLPVVSMTVLVLFLGRRRRPSA